MSEMDTDFKLEMGSAAESVVVSDRDRVERVRVLCANIVSRGLCDWDRRFLVDMREQAGFSPRQRVELDRIWCNGGES